MHLPGSHRAHTLIGGKTVCPARAQTTKAGATQFAVADIRRQVELLVQLHLRTLKKSIVLEISGNGQVKGPSSHYHLPLPFVYRFPFLSA